MNELTYRTSAENGLTFDLIVDGKPLPQLAESHYAGIPYWIIEDDLPNWEPEPLRKQDCDRMVSVCECGEHGCGHTRCRIEKSSDIVVFRDFVSTGKVPAKQIVLTFTRKNYDEVIASMVKEAAKQRKQT